MILYFIISSVISKANPPKPTIFSGDRAFEHLTELCQHENRYYDAPKREESIKMISDVFIGHGRKVNLQQFYGSPPKEKKEFELTNIISLSESSSDQRIIISTHWDTRLWAEEESSVFKRHKPIIGANDGGSGVAVIMELSRVLKHTQYSNIAVDIILFDGEEIGKPGLGGYSKGSEFFVKNISDFYITPPLAVLVLDMVGDKDLQIEDEQISSESSPELWLSIKSQLTRAGVQVNNNPKSIRDDQHEFIKVGIPAALIIDMSYPFWHTHSDTLDKCSATSLDKIGRATFNWLQEMDRHYSTP